MVTGSSPLIKIRNFRLTPLELLIIVFIILGIIFLVTTWSSSGSTTETVNPGEAPASSVWEQTIAASERTAREVSALREELAQLKEQLQAQKNTELLGKRLDELEQRMAALEKGSPAQTSRTVIEHVVAAGETLNGIAQKYSVPVASLRQWNKIPVGSPIRPGQKLRLTAP